MMALKMVISLLGVGCYAVIGVVLWTRLKPPVRDSDMGAPLLVVHVFGWPIVLAFRALIQAAVLLILGMTFLLRFCRGSKRAVSAHLPKARVVQ